MKESRIIFYNTISNFVDQLTRQVLAFFLNPIIINGLGTNIYGIWRMISQTTNYSNVVDMQTSQTLLWSISKNRNVKSENYLRQEVSNAFFVTTLLIPLFLIVGAIILYYIPVLTKVESDYIFIVRVATLILITTFLFNKYFTLFDSLLKGMNLAYKRLGLKAVVSVLNALLIILVLKLNYGIIGIACVELITVIILILLLINILKKNISFFKIEKPNIYGCKRYFKQTISFFLFSIIKTISNNSDLIIIGYFISPAMVTIYVTTRYLTVASKTLTNSYIQASKPTFSNYIGQKNFIKASKVRMQVFDMIWITLIPLSFSLIVLNHSFVNIWISEKLYAGRLENLLIVIYFVLSVLLYNEEGYIKSSLKLKDITIFTGLLNLIFILLSIFLVKIYGLKGFLIAQIGLNLFLLITYQRILRKIFGKIFIFNLSKILRFFLSLIILFSIGYKMNISVEEKFMFFIIYFILLFILGLFIIFILLNQKERRSIYSLIINIVSKH